jgi:hypothetical protein
MSSVGKYNPELKIYFPGIDTPTTNEGFSPSVVVVCLFQGSKFWWRILSNWWRSLFYISKNSFRTTWRSMVFNPFHFYVHENLTDQLVFKVGEFHWFSKQGDKVNNLKQGDTEKINCKAGRYWMLFSIVIFAIAMSAKKHFFLLFFQNF